jgi:hypothetical protein
MFIINFIGVFDRVSHALADLAHEGCRQRPKYLAVEQSTEDVMVKEGNSEIVNKMHSKDEKAACCQPHPKWHYDIRFFEMLGNKRSYFGSVDGWFPRGRCCCITCPPGFLEDFMFFLFNNHFWFSPILCVRGHPFSRVERLSAFFVQVVLCFFFTNLILTGFEVPQSSQAVIQIFAITPISLILRKSFYFLESCPCLVVKKRRGDITAIRLSKAGKFIGIIFLLGLFALHYLAAVYAGRARVLGIYLNDQDALGKVVYSTLGVAMFSDFVITFLKFLDGKRGITFWACDGMINGDNLIGGWYNHYIIENELVEGVHFKRSVINLFVLQIIYVREIVRPTLSLRPNAPKEATVTVNIDNVEMV